MYAQRIDNKGDLVGSNFKVNDQSLTKQLYPFSPSVDIDDETGNFIIVWPDSRDASRHYEVFAQRYYSDGSLWGSNVRINEDLVDSSLQVTEPRSVAVRSNLIAFTWMDTRRSEEQIAEKWNWDTYGKLTDWQLTGIEEIPCVISSPSSLTILPNPSKGRFTIRFSATSKDHISLSLYDISGRPVKTIFEREIMPGIYTAHWYGRDEYGKDVKNGVYFCRLESGKVYLTRKMVVIK